jgi:hypothetical protein
MRDASLSVRLYRWLLRLYPPGFREDYSGPMERELRDELAECRGPWARGALLIRLLADLAMSIPEQLSREASQDLKLHASALGQPSVAGTASPSPPSPSALAPTRVFLA